MNEIFCIRDLIGLWPSRKVLAEDLNRIDPTLRVTPAQVYKWGDVDSVRAKFHYALIQSAVARGFPVTADLLVRLHAPNRDEAVGAKASPDETVPGIEKGAA